MTLFEPYPFFYGASAVCYFFVCLSCAVQLFFGVYGENSSNNVRLCRSVGIILFLMSIGGACYIIARTVQGCELLWSIGWILDYLAMMLIAVVGYCAVTNNQPFARKLALLLLPFVALTVLFIAFPSVWENVMPITGVLLILYFVYYSIKVKRNEHLLDDLYSNEEGHSLKWFASVIAVVVGWIIVYFIFSIPSLEQWVNVALYWYLIGFVLFASVKVSHYRAPVKFETQEQIESLLFGSGASEPAEQSEGPVSLASSSALLQERLDNLLVTERIYVNPDLTIEDVASRLDITPRKLSSLLHNEMQTSFCQYVNGHRIDQAKQILSSTSERMESVGTMCGFNSYTSFYRTFVKIAGMTPSEWRNR